MLFEIKSNSPICVFVCLFISFAIMISLMCTIDVPEFEKIKYKSISAIVISNKISNYSVCKTSNNFCHLNYAVSLIFRNNQHLLYHTKDFENHTNEALIFSLQYSLDTLSNIYYSESNSTQAILDYSYEVWKWVLTSVFCIIFDAFVVLCTQFIFHCCCNRTEDENNTSLSCAIFICNGIVLPILILVPFIGIYYLLPVARNAIISIVSISMIFAWCCSGAIIRCHCG